jgi:hypothetical protein
VFAAVAACGHAGVTPAPQSSPWLLDSQAPDSYAGRCDGVRVPTLQPHQHVRGHHETPTAPCPVTAGARPRCLARSTRQLRPNCPGQVGLRTAGTLPRPASSS